MNQRTNAACVMLLLLLASVAMAEAFRLALSGRPGPVFVELPFDILFNVVDAPEVGPRFEREATMPDVADLQRIFELLRAAERIAARLAEEGFFGPVCADGFTWKDGDRLRLRTLVDLNCRRPMSDCAYRLWRGLDPRSTLYYRFFNRRKLGLPRDLARAVAAPSTNTPPAKASGPGTSPMTRNTQSGLRMGSIVKMRVDSSAGTCLMAFE